MVAHGSDGMDELTTTGLRVTSAGATLDAAATQAWLRQRQANYKTPKLIEFRATLPREDSGKIFKRKLRAPYWEGTGRSI